MIQVSDSDARKFLKDEVEAGEYLGVEDSEESEETQDVTEDADESWGVIEDLANSDFKDLDDQMKGVQLLKGIATADNEVANSFMEKLSDAYTDIAEDVASETDRELQ